MKITIVGAGIAGLSAAICLARKGHAVTVLEESKALTEYGAGLQISPNATRVLEGWGLREDLEKVAFAPRRTFMRRYSSGETLSTVDQNPLFERKYGFPYWQIYRPDLQKVLFQAAQKNGVKVEFGKKVNKVDVTAAICLLEDNTKISGDLIIGADGINSRTRSYVLQDTSILLNTLPDAVYRAVIPQSRMMQCETTADMMNINAGQLWVGPRRALLAYPIAGGELYNIAITAAGSGNGPAGRWDTPVDKKKLQDMFQDFCPEVRSLLDLVDKCAKWAIAELPSMPQWSSNSAKVVLVGDAAHAMSPHVAQGAAMAIEDAAVLGDCLDLATSANNLLTALQKFESIRRPRVDRVAELARENGASMLLEDGPEQRARDERLKMAATPHQPESLRMSEHEIVEPNMFAQWPQPALMQWLYAYDALASA